MLSPAFLPPIASSTVLSRCKLINVKLGFYENIIVSRLKFILKGRTYHFPDHVDLLINDLHITERNTEVL